MTEYASRNARLEERHSLSRELHDAVSQNLFSANLIAETLPDLVASKSDKVLEALQEMQRLNKGALAEMRQLLVGLRAENADNMPFSQILKIIINDVERTFNTPILLRIDSDTALSKNVELAFSRIAKECLINVCKHANASMIDVYFDGMKEQALLRVKDNGSGFQPDQVTPGHMGLQIMNERIQSIGGALDLVSTPTLGTTITVIWHSHDE